MFTSFQRSAAVLASAAVLSMAATPALARDRGWGGGWGGHYGRHHDDGISAGDVLAGVLIIGGIAAIASAASKSKKDREAREAGDEYRYPGDRTEPQANNSADYGRNDADDRPEWREGTGINGAVDRCLEEVERGSTKVEGVDSVNREGDGWRVAGRTGSGQDFACTVDTDGRIRSVSIDGRAL